MEDIGKHQTHLMRTFQSLQCKLSFTMPGKFQAHTVACLVEPLQLDDQYFPNITSKPTVVFGKVQGCNIIVSAPMLQLERADIPFVKTSSTRK